MSNESFSVLKDEVWNFFTVSEQDQDMIDPYLSEDEDILDSIGRKDGKEMTQDDRDALFSYGGYVYLFSALSSIPLVGDLEATIDPCHESDQVDAFKDSLSRKDGIPMTDEDEHALLEFGGLATLFGILKDIPIVGDLEASPFDRMDGPVWTRTPTEPFADVARKDGKPFDSDDSAALCEFAPLAFLNLAAADLFGESSPATLKDLALPCGAPDVELTALGIRWGRAAAVTGGLERADGGPMTKDDDDALLLYGAWAALGTILLGIYRRAVGSLDGLASGHTAPMKRKPSGAELSAWIGRTTQAGLGLSDPKRTVHARTVI